MEFSELKASIRSRIWDTMNGNAWKELDDFSLRLSEKIATRMMSRRQINLTKMVEGIRTNFFSANSISKKTFTDALKAELGNLIEAFRPGKRKRVSKPKANKEVPRNDFVDDDKRQVLRNQNLNCARCGRLMSIFDWDHKDGNRSNNDISNARALCPNCHSFITRKRQIGIKLPEDDV